MKKIIVLLSVLLITSNAFGAELLVKASPHWMDGFTQAEVDKMTPGQKQSYEARSQEGDIISVGSDNFYTGSGYKLPDCYVIKVPDMTESEAKKYEESLIDTTNPEKPVMKRFRKYSIPKSDVKSVKNNLVSLAKSSIVSKIITKTGATNEVSSPVKINLAYHINRRIKQYVKIIHDFNDFVVFPAYAATRLYKTVKPAGGDYNKLEDAMNLNEQNLVTADKYFDVEIDGSWSSADTTVVTIHNYTTDATRYINIYTTTAARHLGVWSTSYYRHATTADLQSIYLNAVKYITINGLQIKNSTKTGSSLNHAIIGLTSDNIIIKNCLIVSAGSNSTSCSGINFTGSTNNPPLYIFNNIIYGFNTATSAGINLGNIGAHVYVYSNTIYGCKVGLGITTANQVIAKNNICYNNTTDYSGTFDLVTTHNLSKDLTAPPLNTFYISKTLTFTNTGAGTEDFHLVSTDTDAIDKGTNTSGESAPLNFNTDIDGQTRSDTWDIGADEYVAPAGGAVGQVIMISE